MDRIAKNVALKFEIKEEKATIIRGQANYVAEGPEIKRLKERKSNNNKRKDLKC